MKWLFSLLKLLICFSALADESVFRSSTQQAVLLELYTSEGCSSCPPADRWFSQLLNHPGLWSGLVPVAFHVDYWNYIGWEDRFSRPIYSARQRRYKQEGAVSGVYTPGVVAAGQEWRSWRRAPQHFAVEGPAVGVLTLKTADNSFDVNFKAEPNQAETARRLHIAVLGFAMKTSVRAGENLGRLLTHDFVVIGYNSYLSKKPEWQGKLPTAKHLGDVERLALVAWVSPVYGQRPLQAVGGWFTKH